MYLFIIRLGLYYTDHCIMRPFAVKYYNFRSRNSYLYKPHAVNVK